MARRKTIILIIAAAVVLAAAFAYFGLSGRQKAAILMYHHVVEDGQPVNSATVTESRLEEDFSWLSANGYNIILPRDLLSGKPLPQNTVIISFDDGYTSNYEIAYPLLKKYGLKAEINVITSLIDDETRTNFCSWDQLREMEDSGIVEIGSHTHNLHNPDNGGLMYTDRGNGIQHINGSEDPEAYESRVLQDIRLSREKLEKNLGKAPVTFAYPFGCVDKDAYQVIKDNFGVSLVTDDRNIKQDGKFHNLHRIAVNMDKKLEDILK